MRRLFRRDRDVVPFLWHPSQYAGQARIAVQATQLEARISSAAERRRILTEWIAFLGSPTELESIEFVSRVPQELLDAVVGQPQLRALSVKWGPYGDIEAVGNLGALTELRLGGATALADLSPLVKLPRLETLMVSQAYRVESVQPLADLTTLIDLTYGNDYPGDDRSIVLPDLAWLERLLKLRRLALPGTRLIDSDLSPIAALAVLEDLTLPLRRAYRRQVLELAETHEAFAKVVRDYEAYDHFRSDLAT